MKVATILAASFAALSLAAPVKSNDVSPAVAARLQKDEGEGKPISTVSVDGVRVLIDVVASHAAINPSVEEELSPRRSGMRNREAEPQRNCFAGGCSGWKREPDPQDNCYAGGCGGWKRETEPQDNCYAGGCGGWKRETEPQDNCYAGGCGGWKRAEAAE